MTVRRLTALAALVACALATPASAGGELYDEYCIHIASYSLCTPPLPLEP